MCLEALKEGFYCFPERDWEGVLIDRNPLSLLKLSEDLNTKFR